MFQCIFACIVAPFYCPFYVNNAFLWNILVTRGCSGAYWKKRKSFPISELWKDVEDDHQIQKGSALKMSQKWGVAKVGLQTLVVPSSLTTQMLNCWGSYKLKVLRYNSPSILFKRYQWNIDTAVSKGKLLSYATVKMTFFKKHLQFRELASYDFFSIAPGGFLVVAQVFCFSWSSSATKEDVVFPLLFLCNLSFFLSLSAAGSLLWLQGIREWPWMVESRRSLCFRF